MEDDNKQEKKEPLKKPRQIILETDGNSIKIIKAEVAGSFEFRGILQSLLESLITKN